MQSTVYSGNARERAKLETEDFMAELSVLSTYAMTSACRAITRGHAASLPPSFYNVGHNETLFIVKLVS